jgi:hypothetical protein
MRKLLIVAISVVVLGCWSASASFGARNPVGSGQPGTASVGGAACGSPGSTAMPAGFATAGFANAAAHYAGSPGTPSAEHGSATHAISEYDIACYQQTQNH